MQVISRGFITSGLRNQLKSDGLSKLFYLPFFDDRTGCTEGGSRSFVVSETVIKFAFDGEVKLLFHGEGFLRRLVPVAFCARWCAFLTRLECDELRHHHTPDCMFWLLLWRDCRKLRKVQCRVLSRLSFWLDMS